MGRRRVIGAIGAILLMPDPSPAPPPLVSNPFPGPQLGETRSEWLRPWIQWRVEGIAGTDGRDCACCVVGTPSARWFSEDGEVRVELQDVHRNAGFFHRDGTYFGLDPSWELTLAREGIEDSFVASTASGHVFLHLSRPSGSETSVDVYHAGRLVRTVGPFPGNAELHLNGETGAFALSVSRERAPDSVRIRMFGASGEIFGDETVALPHVHVEPHPDARGVIFYGRDREAKLWLRPGKAPVPLEVWGPNSTVVAWLGEAVVFREWSPDGMRLSRVDLDSGRSVWHAPPASSAVADGDWLYVHDLEIEEHGDRDRGRLRILVRDPATGEPLHVWRGSGSARDAGELVRSGGAVYFVTKEGFALLDPDVVRSGRSGWEPASESPSGGSPEGR